MAEIYKKATINPKNNGSNCFQYALKAVLNYHNIKSHPERASNLKLFVDQYNLKEINFRPHSSKDWKIFDLNYKKVALNIFFVPYNTKKVRLAYKSKHNRKRENQGVFLMITDGKKGHYLAVKSFPALLKRITSITMETFIVSIAFTHTAQKINLKSMKEYAMILITVM